MVRWLVLAWSLVGCFEEEEKSSSSTPTTPTPTPTTESPPLPHECDAFTPRASTGSFEVTLDAEDGAGSEAFTAPADARLGALVFTHAAEVNDLSVGLGVESQGREVESYGIFEAEDGDDLGIRAAVSPGHTVDLVFSYFAAFGLDGELPYTGTVDWTWTEGADCYEPNDRAADARGIPLGEDLEAWMFEGMGPGGQAVDWYRFRVDARAELTVSFDGPATIAPAGQLSTPGAPEDPLWDGANDFASAVGEDGQLVLTWVVDPGEYLLRLEPFVGLAWADLAEGGPEAHLVQPYSFRVDAVPVD